MTATAPAPLLDAKNLSRHYQVSRGVFKPPATVKALNGVSFSLAAGQTLAVVGESGCGKSTLARALTLIEKPTGGSLELDGTDAATASVCPAASEKLTPLSAFTVAGGLKTPRETW